MEWYYSYLYWFGLRDLVLFNTLGLTAFSQTLIIHLLSEIGQSSIRFSALYYRHTDKVQCHHLFADDSDLEQWRNRMSMDLVLRLYASITSGVVVAFMLIAMGEKGFDETYESDKSNDFYT